MEMEKVDDDDGGYTPPAVPASPTSTPSNSLESTKSPPPPPTPIEEVRTPTSQPQPALMTEEKDMAVDNNTDDKVSSTEEIPSTADPKEETSSGLFAGLSLSSPTSNNNESTTAANPSQTATTTSSNTDKTQTTTDKTQTNEKPTSRASTPVHSNASPGGDIDMKKKKATSSPLVVRSNSINSSTAPTIPPLSTNKPTPNNNNNKPQKLSIAIPPTTKISHPDTTLRLLRKFYTKSSTNIPISAGGKQVSSWYGWVFGGSAEIGGDMVSTLLFCVFVFFCLLCFSLGVLCVCLLYDFLFLLTLFVLPTIHKHTG